MKYDKLSEVLFSLPDIDFEEVSSKLELNFRELEDKNLEAEKVAYELINNPILLIKPYSKNTLLYLSKLCLSKDRCLDFDIDMNVLICDGLCYLDKEDNVDKIKITNDLADSITKMLADNNVKNLIDRYDETEKVIMGIIKVYGMITSEDIFQMFTNVKNSDEDEFDDEDNFEHFLYHRDNINSNYEIFEYEDDEYFFGEQIEDPEDAIEELLADDTSLNVFSRNEYIKFAEGSIFVTDNKALSDFKTFMNDLTNGNEKQSNDIVNTVMYDIKMGNLDDLMLDIMTYVDISTDEEHEEIKDKLSVLYEKTPTWKGIYLTKA